MSHDFPFDHFLKISNKNSSADIQNKNLNFMNSQNLTQMNSKNAQDEELALINNETLNHLKNIVPELKFKTYFENNLELKTMNEATINFEVKTAFIKKTVDLYKDEIAKAIFNGLGTQY